MKVCKLVVNTMIARDKWFRFLNKLQNLKCYHNVQSQCFESWHLWLPYNRAWVSAALLIGVQSGAPFFASATRPPLSFSEKSARWVPLAKIGERERKTRSFLRSYLLVFGRENFLKIHIFLNAFHSFWYFKIFWILPTAFRANQLSY